MKTLKNKIQITLFTVFAILGVSNTVQAQEQGENYKIVFQLTDDNPRSQKALTGQLKNLTKGLPKAEIEVVVHSAGISYLLKDKSAHKTKIEELAANGVVFKACENTLKSKGIEKSAILEISGFVPFGIGEVVKKQMEGWSYIKAGL